MYKILALALSITLLFSCSGNPNSDNPTQSNCDTAVIISPNMFTDAPGESLTINSVEIIEDCLLLNYSAGGCSGNDWKITLIDAGVVLESDPPKRRLRVSFENPELCEAYITKEKTFDISGLQIEGGQVQFTLMNNGQEIIYTY